MSLLCQEGLENLQRNQWNEQSEKIEILDSKRSFDGYSKIDEITFRQKLGGDAWSGEINREVYSKGHAVAIIPFCHRDLSVVLVNQTRIACMVGGCSCDQWEIPAGLISQGESPSEAASRELEEETGINNVELEYICEYFPSPGNSSDKVFLFLAKIPESKNLSGEAGVADEGEHTYFQPFHISELEKMVADNEIKNSTTMLAYMWVEKNLSSLL